MGVVIRPQAFVRGIAQRSSDPAPSKRRIDGRLASIALALIALGLIIALAGAAFTVRTLIVLCFATLAGRARRVGLQGPRL